MNNFNLILPKIYSKIGNLFKTLKRWQSVSLFELYIGFICTKYSWILENCFSY